MYAVAMKQRAFLLMIAITSLSTKRNSHDISFKTSNTYSSQLTVLWICRFLHVKGPAAGAKPYNPPPPAGVGVLKTFTLMPYSA